jgi:hypothetical protein
VVTTSAAPTTSTAVPRPVLLPSTTAAPAAVAPVTTTTQAPKVVTPAAESTPSTTPAVTPSVTVPAVTLGDDPGAALAAAAVQAAGISGAPNGTKLSEAESDLSIAAGVIQISEADLVTALKSGQSLAQVATAKGVDPQKVIDALVADAQSEIAAALAANKITPAQANQLSANVVPRVTNQVNATRLCGGGAGGTAPAAGAGRPAKPQEATSDLSIAAGVIQIPEADLVTALKSGQSLAQVATAKGVDPQKVIDALVADAQSEIAAALAANMITPAQANQLSANVVPRVTNVVNTVPGTRR